MYGIIVAKQMDQNLEAEFSYLGSWCIRLFPGPAYEMRGLKSIAGEDRCQILLQGCIQRTFDCLEKRDVL